MVSEEIIQELKKVLEKYGKYPCSQVKKLGDCREDCPLRNKTEIFDPDEFGSNEMSLCDLLGVISDNLEE